MFLKRVILFLLLFVLAFIQSACTVRSDAASLYKQETPLEVDIILPAAISAGETAEIQVVLTQKNQKVEGADFVHFEVWKQDRSVTFPMEEAQEAGTGVYEMAFFFEKEGLYFIEVHAGNDGSLISPQKQFVVGELSTDELNFLKEGDIKSKGIESDHH